MANLKQLAKEYTVAVVSISLALAAINDLRWLAEKALLTVGVLVISWYAIRIYNAWFKPRKMVSNRKEKAIFISGCDTGFGHELAKQLSSKGFIVFAGVLFPDGEGALALKSAASSNLHVLKLDVTKDEDVEQAVESVKERLGAAKLWAILNVAGIGFYSMNEWGPPGISHHEQHIQINTLGSVRVTKAFLPLLRHSSGGRVILTSSCAGRFIFPGLGAYCMSKFAVRAFGDSLRRELRSFGIHVSVIEPTMYQTPITDPKSRLGGFQDSWNAMPRHVRDAYGVKRYSECYETVKAFLKIARKDINEVVNCFMDAIECEDPGPEDFYRICGFGDQISFWFLEAMPEFIQDRLMDGPVLRGFGNLFKGRDIK